MCGIVGFTSRTRSAVAPLINGLRRLEYRGYDSAGMALESPDGLQVYKCKGKVAELAKLLEKNLDETQKKACTIGIAHTRWATHGLPTEVNAHPQLADGGRLALVHNGIIENYAPLRAQLERRGCVFVSQTDTEVLAHLIATFDKGDFLSAVTQALRQIRGTYGIAVLSCRHPGEMIVARCGSPLVIGIGEDAIIAASDVSAIVEHTRQVIYLDDGDVARITPEGVNVYTLDNAPVTREVKEIEWDLGAVEKGGFEHFMLKEIFEQPDILRNTIRGRLDMANGTAILSGLNLSPRELASINRAVIVACGTSLHAGMAAKYLIESLADIPTSPEQAAEFRYCNPIVGPEDLVLAISQSGETADTLAAVRESIRKGALVAGLCNVVGSTIAREIGRGVYLHAGPEISVASTKAFTAQVTTLLMIALKLGRTRRFSREEGAEAERRDRQDRREVCAGHGHVLHRPRHSLSDGLGGRAEDEGSQLSARRGLSGGGAEARSDRAPGREDARGGFAERHSRQGQDDRQRARVPCAPGSGCRFCDAGDKEAAEHCNDVVELPPTTEHTAPIVTAVALQLFAYHVARLRGCEIDQPRNLAKSVTVE